MHHTTDRLCLDHLLNSYHQPPSIVNLDLKTLLAHRPEKNKSARDSFLVRTLLLRRDFSIHYQGP